MGLGEERRNPWLYTQCQASPGPKYVSPKHCTNQGKAKQFDKSPRSGCSTAKHDLPPRFEIEAPGPGAYDPQYQNLSTFK